MFYAISLAFISCYLIGQDLFLPNSKKREMRRRLLFTLLACSFSWGIIAQNDSRPDYVLPLKIKPVVSGSFGELRSNHFHSGLDLTTNGKTGYRVYASDEGSVSRIKVSSAGMAKLCISIIQPDIQRFMPTWSVIVIRLIL